MQLAELLPKFAKKHRIIEILCRIGLRSISAPHLFPGLYLSLSHHLLPSAFASVASQPRTSTYPSAGPLNDRLYTSHPHFYSMDKINSHSHLHPTVTQGAYHKLYLLHYKPFLVDCGPLVNIG